MIMILLPFTRETFLPGINWALREPPMELSLLGDPLALQGPRTPEGITTLTPVNPFPSIQNPKKGKASLDVFHAFNSRPKGDDPDHVKLLEAGFAMAKRMFHPPEVNR